MVTIKELQQYAIQLVAECFATCVHIIIGEATIANYKFTKKSADSTLPTAIAFGIGVYSALMLAGPITGAHINPALSISLMTIRKLKPIQCISYVIGQIVGAFLGAALVYIVYLKQFDKFDGGIRQMIGPNGTADIFFTMPAEHLPHWNTLIDQIVGTAMLMIFVMSVTHESNQMVSESAKPFAYVLIVTGIIIAFSINAGAAINPARDLGPRLFGAFVYGWSEVFGLQNHFFWVPIVGPIVGAIVGVWLHQGFIWMMMYYGHPPNIKDTDADKNIDSKAAVQIKENDSLEF